MVMINPIRNTCEGNSNNPNHKRKLKLTFSHLVDRKSLIALTFFLCPQQEWIKDERQILFRMEFGKGSISHKEAIESKPNYFNF